MEVWRLLLGRVPAHQLEPLTAALRTVVLYLGGLTLVRLGSKRLLGRSTAFDVIVGVMVGSLLSRGVNGGAPVVATLVAAAVLVLLHWLIGFVAHESPRFDRWFNGSATPLVEDGRLRRGAMRRAAVSPSDIEEAARLQSQPDDVEQLSRVLLERNGRFSISRRPGERILEIHVDEGVETIRLRIEE